MKTRFLFPHRFKKVGWALLLLSLLALVSHAFGLIHVPDLEMPVLSLIEGGEESNSFFVIKRTTITDEIFTVCMIVGAMLAACSREKQEDEFIAQIRLESLLWATYINYALLLVTVIFIYGSLFFEVMIYNMFTLLLIFLLRFHFILYSATKLASREK
ncbi:MAG: hypothetical protein V4714_05840 [Bacteroidota bacterium]